VNNLMTAEQAQQIKDLFDVAFDLAPEDREHFLLKECNGDFRLFTEVQKLFAANDEATGFLESPPPITDLSGLSLPDNPGAAMDRRIGHYQLIKEIGRGGMARVFLANRADDTFEKQVAIKLISDQVNSEATRNRFLLERNILARLEHPYIARLLDGGTTEDDAPYFVMEFVDGLPINQYCEQHQLNLTARLQLFRQVCQAVQYAHQNLVVHRDLKPSNILVTPEGTPKLLDFGIAKLLEIDESSSALTKTQFPFTPEYASPEQVSKQLINTATDIYSLGVLLYELLTGKKPYDLKKLSLSQLAHVICEEEPTTPKLNYELDNILLRALRKEPAARYNSVEQFAEDVRRYLAGEPVLARPTSFAYRAGKFLKKNKIAVVLAAILLLTFFSILVSSIRQNIIAKEQARVQRRQLYASQMKQGLLDWQEGNLLQVREKMAASIPKSGEEELRGFEWYYLSGLLQGEKRRLQFTAGVTTFAFSPDGKNFATGTDDGSVFVSNAATGQQILALPKHNLRVRCIAFSPDGKSILIGDNGGTLKLWNWAESQLVFSISVAENKPVFAVTFAPDGKTFASANGDSTAKIWDANTGELLQVFGHSAWVRVVRYTHDGKTLLTGSNDPIVRFWDVTTGKLKNELAGYGNEVLDLALTPDEKFLAVGGLEHEVKLFDLASRKIVRTFAGHTASAWIISLSPDGKMLAATGPTRPARVWDVATGRELFTINAHDSEISLINFSPDGTQFITSDGETLKFWELQSLLRPQVYTSPGQCHVSKIVFSADGSLLASGELKKDRFCSPNPHFSVWDMNTGKNIFSIAQEGSISSLSFGLGNDQIVLGRRNGFAEIWELPSQKKLFTYQGQADPELQKLDKNIEEIASLAVSPDKQLIATGDLRKTIKLWTPNGQEVRTLRGPGLFKDKGIFPVHALAFSQHGNLLAVGGDDPNVDIFNPQTGVKILSLATEHKPLYAIQFSPDDQWIAAAGNDQIIRIWHLPDGKLAKTLRGHSDAILDLAWTPDGTRLASASKDKTIRLWNPDDGLEVLAFRDHKEQVSSVAFSPDGKILASGSWDGTIRVRRINAPVTTQ
jgi:eukaryotic-like serine/threonine-protein kinase